MLQSLASPRGRREHGLFLVEGVRLVEDALRAGHSPQVCLYDEDALKVTPKGKSLLRALRDPRLRSDNRGIQEAAGRAVTAASTTQHPQPVVAAFKLPKWDLPTADRAALVLVSDNVQDPGNMGTILRTAEAAGVDAVLLSGDSVDIYNPKVVRGGMGAHFRLPTFTDLTWDNIGEMLASLGVDRSRTFATESEADAPYDTVDWTAPAALIISNEAHGLSQSAREYATHAGGLLTIPMQGDTESLNAAIASAVILFEAARQRRVARMSATTGRPE
jgi:RNA methyltransferase, TrmH family